MPPSPYLPNSGGVLSPNQVNLTLDQRRAYDRFRTMGIADLVARQLAVAITLNKSRDVAQRGLSAAQQAMCAVEVRKKNYSEAFVAAAKATLHPMVFQQIHVSARGAAGGHASRPPSRDAVAGGDTSAPMPLKADSDVIEDRVIKADDSLSPPAGVRAACRRGLDLMTEHGGPGLTEGAKARARSMAAGDSVTPDQVRRMKAYFSRHTEEKTSSPPSPGYVAWLLWGGDAGKSWATSQAEKLEKASGNKPLGAAYSHARAKTKDKKKQKQIANRYLRSQGHEPVSKSSLGPLTQEFVVPQEQPPKKKKKKDDDKIEKAAEPVAVSLATRIVKAEQQPWQNLVYSVVYAPDDLDTDGDFMDAATIEKAAHEAMAAGIYINHEHQGEPIGAHVVESYIAPCRMNLGAQGGEDVVIEKGTWMMAMKVTDPVVWGSVIDGTYGGFSLEGTALAETQAAA